MKIMPITEIDDVKSVLAVCKLPIEDISAVNPPQFFGVTIAGCLEAVVGLELFGNAGLIRSLAVLPAHRGNGFAKELVAFAEEQAASLGTKNLFLLTETAEAFFLKLGYQPARRSDAPQAIKSTPQFSSICPDSSAFLTKRLG